MAKRWLAGIAAVGMLALAACSGTGKGDDAGAADTKDLKYAIVTHGMAGDAFWDRVKSGAERAGDDYGVDVAYSSDNDPAKQSQLIDAAVADKVDGIVVSMANPDGLEDSIKAAVAAGVPVITINSGTDRSKEFGAMTHIGQSETVAGEAAGERMSAEGFKKSICVVQEAGNVGLEERCRAAKSTFTGTMENIQVDGTDDNAVQATITSKLQADPDIDVVLNLGAQFAIDGVAATKAAGSKAANVTFDLSEDVLNAVQSGDLLFAIDQQPYVQGYLGITGLYLKSINGNDIGGGQPINSGPAFITKENAADVLEFAKKGTR